MVGPSNRLLGSKNRTGPRRLLRWGSDRWAFEHLLVNRGNVFPCQAYGFGSSLALFLWNGRVFLLG